MLTLHKRSERQSLQHVAVAGESRSTRRRLLALLGLAPAVAAGQQAESGQWYWSTGFSYDPMRGNVPSQGIFVNAVVADRSIKALRFSVRLGISRQTHSSVAVPAWGEREGAVSLYFATKALADGDGVDVAEMMEWALVEVIRDSGITARVVEQPNPIVRRGL